MSSTSLLLFVVVDVEDITSCWLQNPFMVQWSLSWRSSFGGLFETPSFLSLETGIFHSVASPSKINKAKKSLKSLQFNLTKTMMSGVESC